MINSITSNSPYISVTGGSAGHPYISPGSQSAGMMRWNVNTNVTEVYNGTAWIEMRGSSAYISMSPQTEMVLRWAEQKMNREAELKKLAEENPSVATALANLTKAEEQLELIATLAMKHEVNE